MISGRGLGPTGGTLDKLEAIAGFRTNLSLEEIRRVTSEVGCVIAGATAEIAPADKKLYALRDVTGTVASIPLITASIMSKKLAEGLQALVLDVKWGSGAFMKSIESARELAQSMVATGKRMQVATTALLTDMNQPLGRMAGNAVEIRETLDTLEGHGPRDLVEITLSLGSELLLSTKQANSPATARSELQRHLDSGAARETFAKMVAAQGGSLDVPLSIAPSAEFLAEKSGWISGVDTEQLGWTIIDMGGGRRKLSDAIDHSVGLEILVRIGDRVEAGQPLVRMFASGDAMAHVRGRLADAFEIQDQPFRGPELILERIS
jgi:pyrimidine-nucleoside phosphorylase